MVQAKMDRKKKVIPITAGRRNPSLPTPIVSASRVGSGIAITIAPRVHTGQVRDWMSLLGLDDSRSAGAPANHPLAADEEDDKAVKYFIAKNDRIRVLPEGVPEPEDAELVFGSAEELQEGVAKWPLARLVGIWNKLPEGKRIKRFENRRVAVDRIWRAMLGIRRTVRSLARAARQAEVGGDQQNKNHHRHAWAARGRDAEGADASDPVAGAQCARVLKREVSQTTGAAGEVFPSRRGTGLCPAGGDSEQREFVSIHRRGDGDPAA